MPEKVISIIERVMRNFFWEGHKGGKLSHLVRWDLVTRNQFDGGFGIGGLKSKNIALLAKWGWRYMKEEDSLWVSSSAKHSWKKLVRLAHKWSSQE